MTQTDGPELLPCPHCGAEPEVTEFDGVELVACPTVHRKPYQSCAERAATREGWNTRADLTTAAVAAALRGLWDAAAGASAVIAHGLSDGNIDERVEEQFQAALDEINTACDAHRDTLKTLPHDTTALDRLLAEAREEGRREERDRLRDIAANAFIDGATEVHICWHTEHEAGNGPPRCADFSEAAYDYASSIATTIEGDCS